MFLCSRETFTLNRLLICKCLQMKSSVSVFLTLHIDTHKYYLYFIRMYTHAHICMYIYSTEEKQAYDVSSWHSEIPRQRGKEEAEAAQTSLCTGEV